MSNTNFNMSGCFYNTVNKSNNYSRETRDFLKNILKMNLNLDSICNKRSTSLENTQCGRTGKLIASIALAFDNGFDIAILLTKNNKMLRKQTQTRMTEKFKEFIEKETLQIIDQSDLSTDFINFELYLKTILIINKEENNLISTRRALSERYPEVAAEKILIFDDEMDFISIE